MLALGARGREFDSPKSPLISLVLIDSNTNDINLTLDRVSWALPQRMSAFELGWMNDGLHSEHFLCNIG